MKAPFYQIQSPVPQTKKAILVGVELPRNGSAPLTVSFEELEGLATTANYQPIARLSQKLSSINPKTFLGSGKVEELQQAVKHHHPNAVIFDVELSPGQNRNLENIFKCRVIDRSWLILEIFNDHARTREAKTQVELARLKYALPRLTRMWGHLSRQRGGIGLKDVGETQIQLDRRLIRNEITKLERKLKGIDKEKITQRKGRKGIYRVALVGYTNVGKSTLMNRLTGSDTLVENKLFATLDATIRKIKKNFPYPVLLADTVGLIDKLPHDLVASFKSTLDEVREADLLIKLVDLSHPDYQKQMETVDQVLNELGAQDIDSVLVFNKLDRISDPEILSIANNLYPQAVLISCRTGEGIENLQEEIIRCYQNRLTPYTLKMDYSKADQISQIRKQAIIVKEEYEEDQIVLSLRLPPEGKARLNKLLKRESKPAAL
ncbi:MAG: GTPase HflX [Nitrospinaceae bacterium]|nr:MAG: GTPase HflX [Nitrospinaceae bacterium]